LHAAVFEHVPPAGRVVCIDHRRILIVNGKR
jgi:hypothetical protein